MLLALLQVMLLQLQTNYFHQGQLSQKYIMEWSDTNNVVENYGLSPPSQTDQRGSVLCIKHVDGLAHKTGSPAKQSV